ncbi:MAG: adenylate/guanylate cyclase domain-containing protein [Sideroxydans sp.]|nr:adenylate/guanylate cyclase domain-containing protein [Sideroxydans sp.]
MDKQVPQTTRDKVVLFADVSGSTRLYEVLGDARAFAAINQCISLLRRVTETFQGRVVKTIGDEIMTVFPTVLSGVQAACAMQTEVEAMVPLDAAVRLGIRIGMYHGPVLMQAGDADVFGDTVNVAARLTELANAGQILSADSTVQALPPLLRTSTRSLDLLPIKGKAADIKVVEVLWQEGDDATVMVGRTHSPTVVSGTLRLQHGGREAVVDAAHGKLVLGRDVQADFIVEDKRASRLHATIELRRDKFVYIDQSSNGSYITFAGESELQLRREEIVLRGSGSICLGHSISKDAAGAISFGCESG